MADPHTEPDQPYSQVRVPISPRRTPGVAVVHVHLPRQSESAKALDQVGLDRLGSLVRARLQNLGKARVAVEHGQRVAPAVAGLDEAFEVDLRELVRGRMLEALPRLCGLAGRFADPAVPLENLPDRARCRRTLAAVLQHSPDLAGVPDRMRIANLEDLALHRRIRLVRRMQRPARAIFVRLALLRSPLNPLVRRARRYPVPPAQLPDVRSLAVDRCDSGDLLAAADCLRPTLDRTVG